MNGLYFPESICLLAHLDYLEKTGKNAFEMKDYCLKHPDFFLEVIFSYVEDTPYPTMKENA